MDVRRQTVEHPFGTLKSWMGSTQFLTKTLEKVRTQMSLHVLAYNVKRMIQMCGVRPLIHAIWLISLRARVPRNVSRTQAQSVSRVTRYSAASVSSRQPHRRGEGQGRRDAGPWLGRWPPPPRRPASEAWGPECSLVRSAGLPRR